MLWNLLLTAVQGPVCSAIKAPHRYAVQGSDTTMLLIAVALPGQ